MNLDEPGWTADGLDIDVVPTPRGTVEVVVGMGHVTGAAEPSLRTCLERLADVSPALVGAAVGRGGSFSSVPLGGEPIPITLGRRGTTDHLHALAAQLESAALTANRLKLELDGVPGWPLHSAALDVGRHETSFAAARKLVGMLGPGRGVTYDESPGTRGCRRITWSKKGGSPGTRPGAGFRETMKEADTLGFLPVASTWVESAPHYFELRLHPDGSALWQTAVPVDGYETDTNEVRHFNITIGARPDVLASGGQSPDDIVGYALSRHVRLSLLALLRWGTRVVRKDHQKLSRPERLCHRVLTGQLGPDTTKRPFLAVFEGQGPSLARSAGAGETLLVFRPAPRFEAGDRTRWVLADTSGRPFGGSAGSGDAAVTRSWEARLAALVGRLHLEVDGRPGGRRAIRDLGWPVLWCAPEPSVVGEFRLPDEVEEGSDADETAVRRVLVNRYERDREARQACIEAHGLRCKVCEFDFEAAYGSLGAGFIHVHHVVPISQVGGDYNVDPVRDLVPVCPNCHAMLHRPPDRVLTVAELKQRLRRFAPEPAP